MQTPAQLLKPVVRGAYDVQALRVAMGNRLVGNFKAKLGQEPGQPEEEMSEKAKELIDVLRQAHDRLTDGVVASKKHKIDFTGDAVIGSYTELCLVSQYIDLVAYEKQHFGRLLHILKGFRIYNEYLAGIKGVGPDGKGRSRRKEHLIKVKYIDKSGEEQTRDGLTHNPWLKSKLILVLGGCLLKAKNEPYAPIYYDYKFRMENHVKWGLANDAAKDEKGHMVTSKGKRHRMAVRYMVKRFLVDLFAAWRPIEGFPAPEEYYVGKLGRKHFDKNFKEPDAGEEAA